MANITSIKVQSKANFDKVTTTDDDKLYFVETPRVPVEIYRNGPNEYVIYSDNYCKQRGYYTNTLTSNGLFTLPLLVKFRDLDFYFSRTPDAITTTDLNPIYTIGYINKSQGGVSMYGYQVANINGWDWEAEGYIA